MTCGNQFVYFHFFFEVVQDPKSKEGSKDVTTHQSKTSDIKNVVSKVQRDVTSDVTGNYSHDSRQSFWLLLFYFFSFFKIQKAKKAAKM